MPAALALCALIAAHTLGWPPVRAWMAGHGSADLAIQAALHGGIFLGLAGAALSMASRPRLAIPFLFLGCLATLGLLAEDIMGLSARANGWTKDLLDLGQRTGLLLLFATRFESISRRYAV